MVKPFSSVPSTQDNVASENPAGAHLPGHVRQSRLVAIIRERGFLSVAGGAAEFHVSEMTIRRDLAELEQEGHLVRTHGGARAPEGSAHYVMDNEEPAFEARLRQNGALKERIAAAAIELIGPARTLALDVGTTTYLLAMRLVNKTNLKIFTNSLRNATLLSAGSGNVYIPGGQVRGDEMSISGALALSQFEKMWFDLAFIGVSGITAAGFFDYSLEDGEMKRVYLNRSERKVIVCDSSKFRRMSLVQVSALSDADFLLTDAEPPADLAAALAVAGVEVKIAPMLPSNGLSNSLPPTAGGCK